VSARRRLASPPEAARVLDALERAYPDARCALDFETPLQLLIATILAAQAQDKHINTLTPDLFFKYPTARAWAEAPLEQLEHDLRPTGFFRNKAKAVKGCCAALVERHGGKVPADLDALVALPGVGRKTANVVLGNAFGQPDRVATDTHVLRLAARLGFTDRTDPEDVERDLEALWPAERRTRACHLLQFHGRQVCLARAPRCATCPVQELCPSAFTFGADEAGPAKAKRPVPAGPAKAAKVKAGKVKAAKTKAKGGKPAGRRGR
jgi:endonuclease-3